MKFTKNEKKVLDLLLENAKVTDSFIAGKLKISNQAIGKIRKKLDYSIIDSYSVNINYAKVGIRAFAISLSRLTSEGLEKGSGFVEKMLIGVPNIIQVHRLPNSSYTHILFYGFRDLEELDDFFHPRLSKDKLFRFIENKEIFTFSHNSLVKNDSSGIFKMVLDGFCGVDDGLKSRGGIIDD